MPRTRSRSSCSAALASSCACTTRPRIASLSSSSKCSRVAPSSMARLTRRCCAPSCRSRSMRRRSASALPTAATRPLSAASTRASCSARSSGPRNHEQVTTSRRPITTVTHGASSSDADHADERDEPGVAAGATSKKPELGAAVGERRSRRAGARAAPASRTTRRRRAPGSGSRAGAGAGSSRPPSTAPRSGPLEEAPPPARRLQRRDRIEELDAEQGRRAGALEVAEAAARPP